MKIVSLLLALFLAGCALKQPQVKPVVAIIKLPRTSLSATGFLKRRGEAATLELYSGGQAVGTLVVAKRVCFNGRCMAARKFVNTYLNPRYPDTILKNILLARPIFKSKNLKKTKNGFLQRIRTEDLDIIYKVDKNIYFKDTKNKILIKIKELDG
jgi:hypothetical protein